MQVLDAPRLADRISRPKAAAVSAILAASDALFRGRAIPRLAAAGCDELQIAEHPAALGAMLRDSQSPLVVVGGSWAAVRPFLRVAVDAGATPVVLLESDGGAADSVASESEAYAMGARAVLHDDLAAPLLAAALLAVDAGLVVAEPGARVARHLSVTPLSRGPAMSALQLTESARRVNRPLTNREREILALVAAGTSNKGIARVLSVSANTVKFHLAAVFDKLDAVTRAEAVAEAIRRGELSL